VVFPIDHGSNIYSLKGAIVKNKKSIASIFLLGGIFILSFAGLYFGAEKSSGLIAPGAAFKTAKTGYNGTEGPAVDAEGNVYFTERTGSTIQKWTWSDGKVTEYRKIEGGAIGQAFDTQGRLLICEFSGKVTRDDMKGNIALVADKCDGKKLHIPNDIWVAPNGGIYFTDFSFAGMGMPGGGMRGAGTPGNEPPGDAAQRGGPPGEMPPGANEKINPGDLGIDYVSPDGKKITRVADIDGPNGIIGTPDGKLIYANERNKIVSFTVNPDGTLTDRKTFCNQATDGMAIDERNNVYLIGESITVYNAKGEKIEEITTPEKNCKNMKFAGRDRKTLFVSGNVAVYTLEMAVRGAPTALDLASGKK
jgi:gluconolactonase